MGMERLEGIGEGRGQKRRGGRGTEGREVKEGTPRVGSHIPMFKILKNTLATTEAHPVPAVIPGHYYVTFLNCYTHSGPSSGIAT